VSLSLIYLIFLKKILFLKSNFIFILLKINLSIFYKDRKFKPQKCTDLIDIYSIIFILKSSHKFFDYSESIRKRELIFNFYLNTSDKNLILLFEKDLYPLLLSYNLFECV